MEIRLAGQPFIDADALLARLFANPADRVMIGIVGAPGSGKSTLAEALVARANAATPGHASVLPMDGYHYDDHVLAELGRLDRKGAPDTFDVPGFHNMLVRLRANGDEAVAVPVFDRALELARAGARLISGSCKLIVVEGNYLLLKRTPWNLLRRNFDLTVLVDVPEDTLRDRLVERWRSQGLPEDEVKRKVEENDLPNGKIVIDESAEADFYLRGFIG